MAWLTFRQAQFWVFTPNDVNYVTGSCTMMNFITSAVLVLPYDFGQMQLDFWNWIQAGLWRATYGAIAGQKMGGAFYCGGMPGTAFPLNVNPHTLRIATDLLPASQNLVFRRCGTNGRPVRSAVFRVPNVRASHVVNNVLTSAAYATLNTACAGMATSFVSGGVTFTPRIVHFGSGASETITKVLLNQRVGIIRRRISGHPPNNPATFLKPRLW